MLKNSLLSKNNKYACSKTKYVEVSRKTGERIVFYLKHFI